MITARDNPKIKQTAALVSSARKRRQSGLFVLEGTRLCAEVLREDVRLYDVFYTAEVATENAELLQALQQKATYAAEVSEPVFSKLSDTKSPQGILVTVGIPTLPPVQSTGRYIAFENVNNPANLGAAARTAEALGFSGIFLSGEGVDPYSPKSMRASMGALLRLPIFYSTDFTEILQQCKKKGFTLTGTVVDKDAQPVNTVSFTEREIAVIGNEANGLTAGLRAMCDRLVTIPMRGCAESLNAAAAAAIIMWEMSR